MNEVRECLLLQANENSSEYQKKKLDDFNQRKSRLLHVNLRSPMRERMRESETNGVGQKEEEVTGTI